MRRPQLVTLFVWLLTGVLAAVPAGAEPGRRDADVAARGAWFQKLDGGLQAAITSGDPGAKKRRVIIRTRRGAVPGASALLDKLQKKAGDANRFTLPLVDGLLAEVKPDEIETLAALADVDGISLDAPVEAHQSASDACSTWAAGQGGACGDPRSQFSVVRGAIGYRSSNWDGWDIGVAIIDSGISPSSDLRITASYDFRSGAAVAAAPVDGYGHGTHVAGLIGSSGTRSNGYYQGVAPGARLIALRVLDNTGGGYTSHVIKALEFAVANRQTLGIHVINLSLGHPVHEPAANDPLVLAVESAVRAGIVVVVSAGNRGANAAGEAGYGGISSPGNAPSAITVGAVDTRNTVRHDDDLVARYSSRGPTWFDGFAKPDLVAPGHRLVAPVPTSARLFQNLPLNRVYPSAHSPMPHLRLSGTSMSAAVVSGVVAAMLEVQQASFGRKVTPNAIKAMLQYSALPLENDDRLSQGAGELNMLGALRLARRANPWTAPGAFWLTSIPAAATTIEGESIAWFGRIVWNDHVVWGDSVQYNQVAWANHVVWGDGAATWNAAAVDPLHVVWGDSAVWVNHIVWGDAMLGAVQGNHIVWGDASVNEENAVWRSLDFVLGMNAVEFVASTLGLPGPEEDPDDQ